MKQRQILDPSIRFWSKVKCPTGIGECWQWLASNRGHGYGQFTRGRKNDGKALAHRIAYELVKDKIPEGKHIDHLCRNRLCVNPYHMEVVTPRVNVLRGVGCTAKLARQTHCKRGHPLEGDNLLAWDLRHGHRICALCDSEKHRRYNLRRKVNEP